MNIQNIKEGMLIKNYKELCELLGEKTKTGTSKMAQIKEFERYFSYHKIKYSYVIDSIFKVPLPPTNSMTKYIPLIEKLIMHTIVTKSDEVNKLYISKSNLYETLKMVNSEYKSKKYKKLKISNEYDIPKEIIEDFYNTSDDLLDRNVSQALKSLENQSLIKASTVFTVVELKKDIINSSNDMITSSQYIHRKATEFETALILRLQHDALNKLGLKGIHEVFLNGKTKEFYKMIEDYLNENNNIKFYYNSLELIYNREHIENAYFNFSDYELDSEILEMTYQLLNDNISDKILTLADDRSISASKLNELSKLQLMRTDNSYIPYIKELINKLVIV